MPKFFVSNEDIRGSRIYIKEDYNHIKNVLRKNIGDTLEICDKELAENYKCEIAAFSENNIECKIIEKLTSNTESNLKITIFQGLPKSEKMEFVIQKSVELGVYEITPLEVKNCVVKLKDKDKQKKLDRWQKISEVAAKQCGRNIIPKINTITTINELCKNIDNYDSVIVTYENEKKYSVKQEIEELKKLKQINNIAIVIGPEGGFCIDEINKLKESGAKIVTLGNRILRTETVAISLLSIIMYCLGDFN